MSSSTKKIVCPLCSGKLVVNDEDEIICTECDYWITPTKKELRMVYAQ